MPYLAFRVPDCLTDPFKMLKLSLLLAVFVTLASAHQNFHQLWVNGVSTGYEKCIRMPPSNNPVTAVTSNDITCNVNGNSTPFSSVDVCTAKAGDEITVLWDSSSHPGPITHFLYGPVTDAKTATGVGSWVKIAETSQVNGVWANVIMGNNGAKHTFKLPSRLASGDYLVNKI